MTQDLDGGGRGKGTPNIFPKHLPGDVRHAGGGQNSPGPEMLMVSGRREGGRGKQGELK